MSGEEEEDGKDIRLQVGMAIWCGRTTSGMKAAAPAMVGRRDELSGLPADGDRSDEEEDERQLCSGGGIR